MFALLPPAKALEHVANDEETQCPPKPVPRASLAGLPTELHILISKHLIYPDALSLKHTSQHFFYLVDTGVKLKVAWLMERWSLHLECPKDRHCDLRSDLRFCRGSVNDVESTWSANHGLVSAVSSSTQPLVSTGEAWDSDANAGYARV
ncbi:hypothetical protein E0Z10_g10617 [Xylaria hypoxylon]|uniref:F-box domain-containing protein n=1 Tax=Xylaria hypoxylon TaxID=37992 RepID=A0A4Z0YFV2_9PEZI|nr:hypothetical protein E0Z10_g10617 [Xylaria hypoxylon]